MGKDSEDTTPRRNIYPVGLGYFIVSATLDMIRSHLPWVDISTRGYWAVDAGLEVEFSIKEYSPSSSETANIACLFTELGYVNIDVRSRCNSGDNPVEEWEFIAKGLLRKEDMS